MPRKVIVSLVAVGLSLLISVLSASQLIGHTVRLVDIVGLFGGGMGTGAGLTSAIINTRRALLVPLDAVLAPASKSAQDKQP